MKCKSWTKISGERVQCMLENGHTSPDSFVHIKHHEAWHVEHYPNSPRSKRYKNTLLKWWRGDYDYSELQADARGMSEI